MRKFGSSLASTVVAFLIMLSNPVLSQPLKGQYVADFGGAFTQATVVKAQMGLAGVDVQLEKMLTNNISLGLETGFDVCSFKSVQTSSGEKIYERLAVIPILAKARFCFNAAPLTQVYAGLAAGAYQTVPHLGTVPVGGVQNAGIHAGGSGSVGFSYYFLGSKAIGAEFEYHFFDVGSEELFSYFAVRVNYSILKM